MMCSDGSMSRRRAMQWIVGGISATTGAVLGLPALLSALSPVTKKKQAVRWRSLGKADQFPVDTIKPMKVKTSLEKDLFTITHPKDVYVWRKGLDDFVVYSRSCTDLGCPVNYDQGSECFFCPCHGGIFSKEGERMAGPPKSPLYRYETRLLDGFLEIDLSSVPVMA